jgi:ABC transporter ATM
LDVYTETELMRNINEALVGGGKTSVFIAHRLRTISDAGESAVNFAIEGLADYG